MRISVTATEVAGVHLFRCDFLSHFVIVVESGSAGKG